MFVLEINFHDGVSKPEMLLIRRPHAIIGTSEFAHVVIDGASASFYELRASRGIGREFRCQPISKSNARDPLPAFLDGIYDGEAEYDLGNVSAHLTSIDLDLQLLPNELPDRATLRVLRRALTTASPQFPAVALLGPLPIFVSFPVDQPIIIGRSRKCGMRIDSAEISSEHARLGYNDGSFWVEDLGSSNGTFVRGERISGRRVLGEDETVTLANDYVLAGVRNQQDALLLHQRPISTASVKTVQRERYPAVISKSELVRPQRFVLGPATKATIGRDPANDIWIGAAHVSRDHAEMTLVPNTGVEIVDKSSNGIWYNNEQLPKDTAVLLKESMAILDFGGGVTLAVCSEEGAENAFKKDEHHLATNPVKESVSPSVVTSTIAGDGAQKFSLITSSILRQPEAERQVGEGVFKRFAERQGNQVLEHGFSGRREEESLANDTSALSPGESAQIETGGVFSQFSSLSVFSKILVGSSVVGLLAILVWFVYMNIIDV